MQSNLAVAPALRNRINIELECDFFAGEYLVMFSKCQRIRCAYREFLRSVGGPITYLNLFFFFLVGDFSTWMVIDNLLRVESLSAVDKQL